LEKVSSAQPDLHQPAGSPNSPVCIGQCPVSQQHPSQRLAAKPARNKWAMHGQRQRSPGRTGLSGVPPDCLVCHRTVWCATGLSGVQGDPSCNGQPPNKEGDRVLFMSICASDCPVHPRTEGNYCLPNGAPTTPSCLGAIKGTPSHMEENIKPPLNILRRLDFANTHPIHCP
jgi:hypothetical protein